MNLQENHLLASDGIDRRGMLKCMAWVGTGLVWGISGGLATSRVFGQPANDEKATFSIPSTERGSFGSPQARPDGSSWGYFNLLGGTRTDWPEGSGLHT